MVSSSVKENILVPVGVTLCIYCRSNQVCTHHSLITIVKCKCVLVRVKDGVGISQSDGVTIFIPLPGSDMALHQSSPSWDKNLCIKVIVPHFWGHLKVNMVRVKVMVIIIMVKVRGQVLYRKVLVMALGPRWLAMVSSNTLRVSKWIRQWISSLVRCRRVDLQTVCPFNIRILAVKAEPTLVAGPKYPPKVNLTSGKVGIYPKT
jgi:hypothetical protein